ncbi:hypothetical protein KFL_001870170 [Klebsormidium nitens]|uniref:Uncharacterized protein n=1 Tax=Klebsormidium nitens TaxID=105231 RepID=A0A1Y1I6N8_KLENI|nr:hypothetical protein KFL_001870170 [Klebsormidium nitens]|eukprot:GAQ84396.1 hypothetical protein KFL_001870170 [Klebsormidium nitens]
MWKWISDTVGPPLGFATTDGMLTKEQVLDFCRLNLAALEKPEVKQRIAEHFKAGEQAAEMTTKVQEEIFSSMGIEPKFGISCLGRVGSVFRNDQEVMMNFMELIGREELACDEAEKPEEFRKKMELMQKMHEQQVAMEEHLKGKSPEERLAFIQNMQRQMQQSKTQTGVGGNNVVSPQEQLHFFQQQYAQSGPSQPSRAASSSDRAQNTSNVVQRR